MLRNIFTILILLALAGCSLLPTDPDAGDEPATNETPVFKTSFDPQPGDTKLDKGNVFIDSIDILVLESYPLQFNLILRGSLPTPCHQLRVEVQQPDAQNQIQISAYSVVDTTLMCIQVLKEFEITIPLGSFPTGHYTVWVNGEKAGELDS
jgi:hypothetical protein